MPTMTESGRRVFKTLSEQPEVVNKDERSIIHKITTSNMDLDREVILTRGLDFSYFKQTHSVLFNHDAFDVIGKSKWVRTEDNCVKAMTIFADTERGREMFYLCSEGYINGWSIGMDWMSMKYCDQKERDQLVTGNPAWSGCRAIIKNADVLEYSATPIPANVGALTDQLKQGKIVACKSAIEKIIQPFIDTPKEEAQTVKRIEPVVRRIPVTGDMIRKIADKELRLARGLD